MDQDYIQRIRDTFETQERTHEPWTSGVIDLAARNSVLFFSCKDGSARRIQIGSITEADIQALLDACDPAPFGRGPESVLDDTYRQALKLEAPSFAWRFSPDSGEFISELAQRLCPWDTFEKGIRAEVHKLNIYTQGGFFKAHQDTPQSEHMFGSLVFTLPTLHDGGNLALRHQNRSFNFDVPSILASAPSSSISVAYVAFYSDVKHEVLEVTKGVRITITFNLYFDSSRGPPILPARSIAVPESPFKALIRNAFHDDSFVRKHRYIGFGLEYEYPRSYRLDQFNTERYPSSVDLKGSDAFVFRVLKEVGAKPSLRYLYTQTEINRWGEHFSIMLSHPVGGRKERDIPGDESEVDYLLDADSEGLIVWEEGKSEVTLTEGLLEIYTKSENVADNRKRSIHVDWVTPPTKNLWQTLYTEWGNEPNEEIYYYRACVIVDLSSV